MISVFYWLNLVDWIIPHIYILVALHKPTASLYSGFIYRMYHQCVSFQTCTSLRGRVNNCYTGYFRKVYQSPQAWAPRNILMCLSFQKHTKKFILCFDFIANINISKYMLKNIFESFECIESPMFSSRRLSLWNIARYTISNKTVDSPRG